MSQDIQLALEDLISSVGVVGNLHIVDENIEPGSRPFTLTLSLGPKESQRIFGPTRATWMVGLSFTARKHDLVGIAAKLQEIEDSILEDPRRSGNAQTSYVGEEWIVDEQESREGVTFQNFVGVVIYEN